MAELKKFRAELAKIDGEYQVGRDRDSRIVIKDPNGNFVGALIGKREYRLRRRILGRLEDAADIHAAEAALRDMAENGSLSLDEVERMLLGE